MRIFRGPKIKVYFPVNYLSLNELIGYIDSMDFGEIYPACWSDIYLQKSVRLLRNSKYFLS